MTHIYTTYARHISLIVILRSIRSALFSNSGGSVPLPLSLLRSRRFQRVRRCTYRKFGINLFFRMKGVATTTLTKSYINGRLISRRRRSVSGNVKRRHSFICKVSYHISVDIYDNSFLSYYIKFDRWERRKGGSWNMEWKRDGQAAAAAAAAGGAAYGRVTRSIACDGTTPLA